MYGFQSNDIIVNETAKTNPLTRNNYQLRILAEELASALPIDMKIKWYGNPDYRSYRVDFEKFKNS